MGYLEEIYEPQIEEEQPVNIYEYQNTPENRSWAGALPVKQGLYDPELEKDACGVGFAAYVFYTRFFRGADTDSTIAPSRGMQVTRLLAMVISSETSYVGPIADARPRSTQPPL